MRVIQVMAGAAVGGAEAFFERLVPALSRAGLEQRALIRSDPARAARLESAAVTTLQAPFRRHLDGRTRRLLRDEVAKFRPDLVLCWMSRAASLCPVGATLHLGRLGGYYDLKYYRGCDHLIGNTPNIVDYIRRAGWPAERAHYLPNFVEERHQPPVARASLDTPADAPLLLALGRLHRNKAFDVLLYALADLPDAYLWLAGEGPERGRLERLAAKLGVAPRVRFLGWRADGPALMASCDLVVCPSRHEPLGNVVLEAWAQGRPLVAAGAQGPAGLIRDGVSGLLVPTEDAAALTAALRRALDDPALAGRLTVGGRAAYEAEFTAAAVVQRYLTLFQRLSGAVLPDACRAAREEEKTWPRPSI